MKARSYLLHGQVLTISGEEAVLDALHARLGLFPQPNAGILSGAPGNRLHPPTPPPCDSSPHLQFRFRQVSTPDRYEIDPPPGPSRVVFEAGRCQVLYFEICHQLYIDLPNCARALCDIATGQVRVAYLESAARSLGLLSHLFFTIPLSELLKRRGLYMLHAAALSLGGNGLLITGASGAGKTTLAIALLRAGFGFLGDDTTFLASSSRGVRALAFPDEIDVTDHTAGFFPELESLARRPPASGGPKRSFSLTSIYDVTPTWSCVPMVLVFPQTARVRQSTLTPMSKDAALLDLLCNVLRTDPLSSQAHLDALAALVAQCHCFRFHAGRDFDNFPSLFQDLTTNLPALDRPS